MAALSSFGCSPRREAPRTLRERLECSEGGDTGRRTKALRFGPYRGTDLRPSVQPPARVERKAALYAARLEKQDMPERQAGSEAKAVRRCAAGRRHSGSFRLAERRVRPPRAAAWR